MAVDPNERASPVNSEEDGQVFCSKEEQSFTTMTQGLGHGISDQLPASNHMDPFIYRPHGHPELRTYDRQQTDLVFSSQRTRVHGFDVTVLGLSTSPPGQHNNDRIQSVNLLHRYGVRHLAPYLCSWSDEHVEAGDLRRADGNMQSEKHYSSMQVGTMSEDSPSIERVPQQEDDPNKTHSSKTIKRGNTDMSQEHDLTSIGSSFEEYGPYQTQYPCGVDDDICLHDQLHDSSDRRR